MDEKLLRGNIKIGLMGILLKTGGGNETPSGGVGRWGLWSDTKGGQISKVGILDKKKKKKKYSKELAFRKPKNCWIETVLLL